MKWEISVSHNTKDLEITEKINNTYLYKRNKMKTLNLHTFSYRTNLPVMGQPTMDVILGWANNACDFNSKRIENRLGVSDEVK